MKQRITFLMVCVFMLVGTAMAQQSKTKRSKTQVTPEQRIELQTKHMMRELMLDDKTAAKFLPLYQKYLQELRDTHLSCPVFKSGERAVCSELTDAEITERIENRFKQSQKILDLRIKYYNEFKKILQPRQIHRVYQVEKSCMNRIKSESGFRRDRMYNQGRGGKTVCPLAGRGCPVY